MPRFCQVFYRFLFSRKYRDKYCKYAILLLAAIILSYQIFNVIIFKMGDKLNKSGDQKNVSPPNAKLDRYKNVNKNFNSHGNNNTTAAFKLLKYDTEFAFPLYIDLIALAESKLQDQNFKIKYRPVNPHPFRYIHNPPYCDFDMSKNHTKPILVLVKSAVGNVELRKSIRMTWARRDNIDNLRILFMLGFDNKIQSEIDTEFDDYGDTIQENFIDAYRNNTLKTIMGYNWAVQYCPDAKFLFFVDDDFYVKIEDLVKYLRQKVKKNYQQEVFLGSMSTKGIPFRDKNTKWYVSYEDYPFDKYPPYIGGGAYVISKYYAMKFQIVFPYVKRIAVDDAYLGIVAKKLEIHPRNDPYFFPRGMSSLVKECTHNATEYLKLNCKDKHTTFTFKYERQNNNPKFVLMFVAGFFMCILFCIVPFMVYLSFINPVVR